MILSSIGHKGFIDEVLRCSGRFRRFGRRRDEGWGVWILINDVGMNGLMITCLSRFRSVSRG